MNCCLGLSMTATCMKCLLVNCTISILFLFCGAKSLHGPKKWWKFGLTARKQRFGFPAAVRWRDRGARESSVAIQWAPFYRCQNRIQNACLSSLSVSSLCERGYKLPQVLSTVISPSSLSQTIMTKESHEKQLQHQQYKTHNNNNNKKPLSLSPLSLSAACTHALLNS